MEPNQDLNNAQNSSSASVAPSGAPTKPAMSEEIKSPRDNSKKNKALFCAVIILAIVAAGGIGFGIWAMIDSNSKIAAIEAEKNQWLSAAGGLKKINDELSQKIRALEHTDERVTDFDVSEKAWPVTASLVGDEIHFINNAGETVVEDDFYSYVKIENCTTLEETYVLKCAAETTYDTEGDDDRGVIYDGKTGEVKHWSASGY